MIKMLHCQIIALKVKYILCFNNFEIHELRNIRVMSRTKSDKYLLTANHRESFESPYPRDLIPNTQILNILNTALRDKRYHVGFMFESWTGILNFYFIQFLPYKPRSRCKISSKRCNKKANNKKNRQKSFFFFYKQEECTLN